jgi:cellobiose phosphorylase
LQPTDYGAELNGVIQRTISKTNSEDWLNNDRDIRSPRRSDHARRINIHKNRCIRDILRRQRFNQRTDAGICKSGASSSRFNSPRIKEKPELACQIPYTYPLKEIGDLQRYNGFGGFANGGKEYVIDWNDLSGIPLNSHRKSLLPLHG